MVPWKRRTCVQQSAEDFKEKTGGALEAGDSGSVGDEKMQDLI